MDCLKGKVLVQTYAQRGYKLFQQVVTSLEMKNVLHWVVQLTSCNKFVAFMNAYSDTVS